MKKVDSEWIDRLFREFGYEDGVRTSYRGSVRSNKGHSRSNSASASRDGFYPNQTFDSQYTFKKSPRGYTSRNLVLSIS